MVTYISAKNAKEYRRLFEKAADALIANPPEDLEIDSSFAIGSLPEYFAYLEDLVKLSTSDDENRFFTRLPLDEDFFEIDANARTIKVPNLTFGRYGVGVQGDELAEVVYFKIPQYFDSTDLATKNIVIQWEVKGSNGTPVAGISRNYGKDIETVPGYIIFGWPISSELTENPGTIKFAVRFYSLGEADDNQERKFDYNFTTLPAEVSVNASLNYDIINHAVPEIDHGKTITSRIRNIGIYNKALPIPEQPQITIPLYVMSPAGQETVKIVDLPTDNEGVVKLAVAARPTDIGVIGYNWQKFAYRPASSDYDPESTPISYTTEWIEVPYDEELTDDVDYYTVASFDEFGRAIQATLMSSERIATLEVDDENETLLENGEEITLYKKVSVASVTTVGEYAVDITARAKVNTSILTMPKADRIRIPGPIKPTINLPTPVEGDYTSVTVEDKTVHAIVNNETVILKASAQSGETGKPASEVGENPVVNLGYAWKKLVDTELVDVTEDATHTVDPETHSLTITGLTGDSIDEQYFVEVTSTRNNISTADTSGAYRVTTPPEKPVLTYGGQPVNTTIQPIEKQDLRGNYRALTFNIVEPTLSDGITYLWMHATVDEESDYDEITGQIKAQIDVDGALDGILGNTAFPGEKDAICDPAVAHYEGNEIVFGESSGERTYQLTAEDSGIYYCIVINELNNNKAASVGPFFSVS